MCTMAERGEQDLSNGGIFVGRIVAQTLVQRSQKMDVNGNVAKAQSCALACIFLITSFKSLFFKLSETYRLLGVHGAPSSSKNQRTIALFSPVFALGKLKKIEKHETNQNIT